MNKKTISRILLMSTLTVSLGVLTVSCHVKSKTETENPTPPKEKPLTPEEKLKKELNDEANKVKIEYPKKDEISPSDASTSAFIYSGFDAKKYKILQEGVKPINQGGISVVSFKIVYLKDENKQSDLKEINVSGFKKTSLTKDELFEIAKNIELDYPNKENIYPWDFDSRKILIKNPTPNVSIAHSIIKGINPKNSNPIFQFVLQDNFNNSTAILHTKEISGFKTLLNGSSKLTKFLLDNENGFIKISDEPGAVLQLHKELNRSSTELILDLHNDKVYTPFPGRETKLLNPSTLKEAGTLTSTFKNVYNELNLEVMKLINENLRSFGVSSIEEFSKLFTSTTNEAKKLFTNLKEKFKITHLIETQINFLPGYEDKIEKLIDSKDFEIAYNFKTGMFAMNSGKSAIDFNNPNTFVNFMGFKESLKNEIISKIKEVLTKHSVASYIIDMFLSDNNYISSFVIEKSENKIKTGLKIKQISSNFEKPKN